MKGGMAVVYLVFFLCTFQINLKKVLMLHTNITNMLFFILCCLMKNKLDYINSVQLASPPSSALPWAFTVYAAT